MGSRRSNNRSRQFRRLAGAVCEGLENRLFLHVDPAHPDHEHPLPPLGEYVLPTSKVIKARSAALTPHSGPLKSVTVAASIPALNSYEQADANIFLDFNGATALSWGSYTSDITPAYDTDGDAATFTAGELTSIQTIWTRVSEMFSPFNINVTTVDPGNLTDQETVRVIIGGTGSWYGSAGGVAYLGAFYNTAPNIAWVFPKMLANGHTKYTADAIAHEAGHTFGLRHQSAYSGSTKTAEYNPGTSAKAPTMGNSYSATRSLWWNGATTSSSTLQNDVAVISNSSNGFGYRTDDHGGTTGAATSMEVDDDNVSETGVIEQITDKDYFSFSTLTGTVSFSVAPAAVGGMLDATLSLVTSTGTVITSANTTAMGESITANVTAGQYYLIVGSKGTAGDIGQYTLSGEIVTSPNYVAAPAGLTATASNGQVALGWTDMSWNETGFLIQRSDDNGSTWDDVTTAAAAATTYTDSTAAVGTSYRYRVRANGELENSEYSGTATVSVIPAVPTGLTAESVSATQIDLDWTGVTGATGYRVERSTNNSTWVAIATLGANETDYESSAMASGTRFYFRVIALSGVGNSAATASVNNYTRTAAPGTITGTPTAAAITLAWTNVSGETGYKIERSLDGEEWTQIATTALNVATYSNTLLTANTSYSYRVKAYNAGGDSVVSSTLEKKTLLNPPTGLTAEVQSTTVINLSWTDSTGETNYRVERLNGTAWVQVGELIDAGETDVDVTGLVPGTAYSFRLRAYNEGGASSPSATVTATTIPPAPGTITAAALSTSQIRLTWANIAGETGYKVERSATGEGEWTQIATTAANIVTYTDSSLTADTAFFYRVKAYNASGTAAATTTATTRTVLDAPTGIEAEVVSTTRIDLSWEDSETETGYRLERLSGTTWVQVGSNLGVDASEVTIIGLTAGTAYNYRVRAINDGGLSLPSATVTATTIPAVATLTGTALSDTQIRLNWTNVAGESGYKIERSPDDSDWTQIATTTANTITLTDTSLTSDTNYYYRVRAWNAAGNGEYSTSIARRTLLAAPTGLEAEATSATSITLSWDNSTGETGYRLERLSGTTWVQQGILLAADATETTVTGLAGGTSYSFRLRAISSGGVSLQSSTVSALTRPAAPATLTTTNPAMGQIKLTWANVTGETGFKIERSTDGNEWSQITTVGVNILTYTNTGLSSGTYYYRVKAYNASGDSSASPTANRTLS